MIGERVCKGMSRVDAPGGLIVAFGAFMFAASHKECATGARAVDHIDVDVFVVIQLGELRLEGGDLRLEGAGSC